MSFPVAIQVYSVRGDASADFYGTLAKIKEMGYDGVELEFEPEALGAIADKAIEMKIGARGLRSVMEGIMTDVMFTIPSDLTIKKVIITPNAVLGGEPKILRDPARPRLQAGAKK